MTTTANVVEVSISVSAKIEVTEEMKYKLKNKYPHIQFTMDEDFAVVALFEASDNCLPKLVQWESVEVPISF